MSQSILSRTIASVADKRAVISNGQLMRMLEMTTNWNVIRIGLQVSFDAAANATGTPLLVFGMQSNVVPGTGYANGSATTHFLGVRMGTSASWVYNAGPPKYFDGGAPGIVKKVGATLTTAAFGTGFATFLSADPVTARTALILQITKGSPNYTLDFVAPQGAASAAQTDCDDAKFLSMMEMAAMTSSASIIAQYANWTAGTIAVDEVANGVLNSICIHWDKSAPPFEISSVRVRKVS